MTDERRFGTSVIRLIVNDELIEQVLAEKRRRDRNVFNYRAEVRAA